MKIDEFAGTVIRPRRFVAQPAAAGTAANINYL
ncbi:hypothetical protein SAMN05443144_102240 [Fodinibius roseus]|uniref:Uncharacterized protein n=1 Tax=Fodinibius roseus TaxID=1194090 RepID=A0A1M4V9Y8_9BACT|nr:hypothetical protein SAMN05443144_102240 [Fodinibius roseus]